MLQIESVGEPFVESSEDTKLALRLVWRASMMGLLDHLHGPQKLDRSLFADLLSAMIDSRVGTEPALEALAFSSPRKSRRRAAAAHALTDLLRELNQALQDSPRPESEWGKVREFLDEDVLADLLNISSASVRRYAAGDRRTPDDTAWRLHLIAQLISDLIGSYNNYGIRRWFERPRTQLDGRTPREVIRGAGSEDDAEVMRISELASALAGSQLAA